MFLLPATRWLLDQSVQVELPSPNMKIDPHPNNYRSRRFKCLYHDNGKTVTLTRIDSGKDDSWPNDPEFRVYNPATEAVPDFDSTIYTYLGIDGERAPKETTLLLIDPSVKVIKNSAFDGCRKIKKCIMHDGVHTIEENAFKKCSAMKVIRLSRGLKRIGCRAFFGCMSLDAIFLPSGLEQIENEAFQWSINVRILPLPLNISTSQCGERMADRCYNFFDLVISPQKGRKVTYLEYNMYGKDTIHQFILNFYRELPPLHKVCLDTNVTAETIHAAIHAHGSAVTSTTDHDGMTPLHILAMNPHANVGAILACFHANTSNVFALDSRDRTPLDYLMEYDNIEGHTSLIAALCMRRIGIR